MRQFHEDRIVSFLKTNPTRRYHTKYIRANFGNTKETTSVLKRIREGYIPNLHWSQCRTPKGRGLRYEYFYIPEGYLPEPKVIPYRDFLEHGYLQEANRQFFHPLGLSLALMEDALIVHDFRSKPTGPTFSPDVVQSEKFMERAERIAFESARRLMARQEALGFGVQRTDMPKKERQKRA